MKRQPQNDKKDSSFTVRDILAFILAAFSYLLPVVLLAFLAVGLFLFLLRLFLI